MEATQRHAVPPDVASRLVDLKPMAASDAAIREALWQRIKLPMK